MNNITIDEVKDIFKNSIDETTNMNEAIGRTLEQIYLKGWKDAEKEYSYHLKKIMDEIQAEKKGYPPSADYYKAISKVYEIIIKHIKGE